MLGVLPKVEFLLSNLSFFLFYFVILENQLLVELSFGVSKSRDSLFTLGFDYVYLLGEAFSQLYHK